MKWGSFEVKDNTLVLLAYLIFVAVLMGMMHCDMSALSELVETEEEQSSYPLLPPELRLGQTFWGLNSEGSVLTRTPIPRGSGQASLATVGLLTDFVGEHKRPQFTFGEVDAAATLMRHPHEVCVDFPKSLRVWS